MKKTFIKTLSIAFVLVLTTTQCVYEEIPEPEIVIPEVVSFSDDIIPIFESKCANCHGGSRDPNLTADNAFNSLTTGGYINTSDPASSTLITTLSAPQHAVATEADAALILEWITEGAEDN